MIVIGADTHKRSHTVAAVEAATAHALGERTGERLGPHRIALDGPVPQSSAGPRPTNRLRLIAYTALGNRQGRCDDRLRALAP